MENKKRNIFKIGIVIVDVIAVLLIIYSYIKYVNNRNNTYENNNTDNYTTYAYKVFKYNIPNNISFKELDDKKFRLDLDNAYLIVELYIDKDKQMYEHSDIYHKLLLENNIIVDDPKVINVNDYKVIVFNKTNESSVLCYFATENAFAYEVEIFNNDNSYSTDALSKVIDFLENATYEYDREIEYDFDIIDFSKLIVDNK